MNPEWRAELEARLAELPLLQYEFFRPEELCFSERVRWVCEHECPMYGQTWACPPAVGSVDTCRARCLKYGEALLIATITEVSDIADIQATLATRAPHEAVTRRVRDLLAEHYGDMLVLSTEACAICAHCAYPEGPCRHPEKMFPCVESHGIVVTDLAERFGIDFLAAGNLVTWFSILFFDAR